MAENESDAPVAILDDVEVYKSIIRINFSRLENSISSFLAAPNGSIRPIEVYADIANMVNSIASYHDSKLKGVCPDDLDRLVQACKFVNNRLKHDQNVITMGRMDGGFAMPLAFPFASLVRDFYWIDVRRMRGSKGKYPSQELAYRELFQDRSVRTTLELVVSKLVNLDNEA